MLKNENLIVWNRNGTKVHLAARCGECSGMGRRIISTGGDVSCEPCGGLGWFGIDPRMPVMAHAGSVAKVVMLSVRYAIGVPLWHEHDGYDQDDRPTQQKTAAAVTQTPSNRSFAAAIESGTLELVAPESTVARLAP